MRANVIGLYKEDIHGKRIGDWWSGVYWGIFS